MTPDKLIGLIKKEPRSWLWSHRVQVELFRLLPQLWDAIGESEREVLAELILAGPPRDHFGEALEADEWTRHRDKLVWERLTHLSKASIPLSEKARARLNELRNKYSEWEPTGSDRDYFPIWSESRTGPTSDMSAAELLQLSPPELLEALLSGGYYRDGRLGVWEGLVMEESDRAFPLIEHMLEEQRFDGEVLASTFRALANKAEPTLEMIEDVRRAAANIPRKQWGRGIYPFARTVARLVTEAPPEMSDEVIELWDQSLRPALDVPFPVQSADLHAKAINHPVGYLTETLLAMLRSETSEKERAIPAPLRKRLEDVIRPNGDTAGAAWVAAARTIICSRLSWLYWLDANWATKYVITLLDWKDPAVATGAWQGFLLSPQIEPELWAALRGHFLRAFEHYNAIGQYRTKLPELLAHAYVNGYGLSNDEVRRALRKVDDAGRVATARYIDRLLEGADEKADRLWTEKIGPFLLETWPREKDLRSPRLTLDLIKAALRPDDAFSESVNVVIPLLTSPEDPYMAMRAIADSSHPENDPVETLTLLDAVVADGVSLGYTQQLPDILQRMQNSGIDLDERRFGRLQEAAVRG